MKVNVSHNNKNNAGVSVFDSIYMHFAVHATFLVAEVAILNNFVLLCIFGREEGVTASNAVWIVATDAKRCIVAFSNRRLVRSRVRMPR